jgi:nucleolar protein 14
MQLSCVLLCFDHTSSSKATQQSPTLDSGVSNCVVCADLAVLLCSSAVLPAPQLQVFYGILVQHFAMLAGEQPTPTAHLDILTQVLLQLTPEVPFYAATVARARLEKMHDRLAAALADPFSSTQQQLMGWPGPRQLLQLRLFALLFPASDRWHPVMTPLALLLGKHLSQCPVVSCYTAAVGLLCCGMALANSADAQRFCPEVVCFLAAALRAFVPAPQQQQAADGKQQQQSTAAADAAAGVSLFTPGLLALSCCSLAAAGSKAGKQKAKQARKHKQQQNGTDEQQQQQQQQQLPSLKLYQLLSSAPDAAELSSDEFRLALLGCTVATAARACKLSSGCGVAAPEVLQPLLSAVAALLSGVQGLPAAAEGALQGLQQQLQQASSAVATTRQPMVQSHRWGVLCQL